jgi:phosphoesterase RecJ-like protein
LKIPEKAIDYFSNLLKKPSVVLITAHHNPDGDTIGASLALYHICRLLGHAVKVLIPNDLPTFLKWMPGSEQLINYQLEPVAADKLLSEAELIFCVDFNATSRVKFFSDQLASAPGIKVLIDHHPSPEDEFDLVISTTETSSTSEIIYALIERAGFSGLLTKEIAECLFVGIMTDTGSYSYACNYPETFSTTARLIELGIDVEKIHRLVYDTYSESRMRLLGHCLSNRLKVLPELSTAYIWLTKNDLEDYSYKPGDTEGVVNYALSIENVSFAALFIERDDRIRISLRSKGRFSVNEFARNHFQGGGHRNAAGADSFETLDETLNRFESLLQLYSSDIAESNNI